MEYLAAKRRHFSHKTFFIHCLKFYLFHYVALYYFNGKLPEDRRKKIIYEKGESISLFHFLRFQKIHKMLFYRRACVEDNGKK